MRFAGSNRGKIAMIRFRSHVAKREDDESCRQAEGEASTQMNSKSRHTKQIMGERGVLCWTVRTYAVQSAQKITHITRYYRSRTNDCVD